MTIEHQRQWEFLKKKFESNQLSHAYLFSGPKEAGKELFAKEFVKFINCLATEKPCQRCQNCNMIDNGSFPDLLTLKSIDSESSQKNEKDMMELEIKQVRNAQNFLAYKAYYGNIKTVIVEDAQRMNQEAQSCFLKTLEEPKGKTLIILLSSRTDFLLPTIFSRCQQVKFFDNGKYEISKDEQKVLSDLKVIISSELAEKFRYAKNVNLEEGNLSNMLRILQKYFRQLLLASIGVGSIKDTSYSMPKLKNNLTLIENLLYQTSTSHVNKKLALEVLLLEL